MVVGLGQLEVFEMCGGSLNGGGSSEDVIAAAWVEVEKTAGRVLCHDLAFFGFLFLQLLFRLSITQG